MKTIVSLFWALVFALWAGVAVAQEVATAPIDYTLWDSVADRAETAIDQRSDDTAVYERLRLRIAAFREQFALARQANTERIQTLRDQIEALGAAPENGAEPADIASRRNALEQQLQALQAPVLVADAAFRRADGLVGEIDAIVRERQTRRLLSLGPSPLNPANWAPALQEFADITSRIGGEVSAMSEADRQSTLRENAPLVLLLLALGVVLLARGRHWAWLALERLRRLGGHGSGVWRFLVSLFRIFLPLAGIFAIVAALRATGLAGVRIDELLDDVPIWGAVLLGFRWLAERLFARDDDDALIPLVAERRSEARFYALVLSVLFVLRGVADVLVGFDASFEATEAVITFPIVVVMGLILFRLGQILRGFRPAQPRADADDATPRGTGFARLIRLIGTGVMLVSIAAPVMAAVGYAEAGNALLYPTISSLVILGLVVTFQRFAADIYGLITGQGREGRDALIPVLIGFLFVLLASPVLALAWGARVADLTELWADFARGFQVGDTQISPTDFLAFAIVFVAGYTLTRFVQGALRSNVLPKTKIDPGAQTAIVSGLGYVGIFLAALVAITTAGIDLSSLAIVAGALSVGIGFGLQNIVSNFVSGIILLIERPISEGDWIEVGGKQGYVRNISVRSTRIETFDRSDVIVPNADLVSGTVTNFTRGNTVGRLIVDIGVAYGTDVRKVERILKEIAEDQPMVLRNPPPMILFNNFGADSLEFQMRMILRDVNWTLSVKNDVNHAIAKRFAEEEIEVPFAQRDLWIRNPEALKGTDP